MDLGTAGAPQYRRGEYRKLGPANETRGPASGKMLPSGSSVDWKRETGWGAGELKHHERKDNLVELAKIWVYRMTPSGEVKRKSQLEDWRVG